MEFLFSGHLMPLFNHPFYMFLQQLLIDGATYTLMKSVARSNVSSSFFRRTALLDDTIQFVFFIHSSSALLNEPICASYALMRCIEATSTLHASFFLTKKKTKDETKRPFFLTQKKLPRRSFEPSTSSTI